VFKYKSLSIARNWKTKEDTEIKYPTDKIFCETQCAAEKIFFKKTCSAKFMQQNAPQARFCGLNPDGLFVLLML